MLFAGRLDALGDGWGTSRALPLPMPTRPRSSPTATRAEKLQVLAAFDDFGDPRMEMTWSLSSMPSSSRTPTFLLCLRSSTSVSPCSAVRSELDAFLANGVRQGLDASVIGMGAPVENDLVECGPP